MKSVQSPLPYLVEAQLAALGNRIAVARKARCWTQGDLANRAGVGLNSIVNIERGAPTVQFGYWALALWALGLLDGLGDVAQLQDDREGLELIKERMPRRVRGTT